MSPISCPICGAKIRSNQNHSVFKCDFCRFERRPAEDTATPMIDALEKSFNDLPRLMKIKPCAVIHIENADGLKLKNLSEKYQIKLLDLPETAQNLDCIWADMTLPYIDDLSGFLSKKFHQLKKGGLLYLSLPVTRPGLKPPLLPGQINFFMPKNIMFLLEQRGFKMVWRKNRFSPTLRIIARKD